MPYKTSSGKAEKSWTKNERRHSVSHQRKAFERLSTLAMVTMASQASQRNKNVSFSQIEIIEMPYAIGDGPATGVPISIDWEAQDRSVFTVDFFEQYRPRRRPREELRLPDQYREQL